MNSESCRVEQRDSVRKNDGLDSIMDETHLLHCSLLYPLKSMHCAYLDATLAPVRAANTWRVLEKGRKLSLKIGL